MRRRSFLAGVGATALVASCSGPATGTTPSSTATGPMPLAPTPPAGPGPLLSATQVGAAVDHLDGLVADAMTRSGVPGVAVVVVYQDQIRHAKGYGVRKVGQVGDVDADTVFQLASLSKPLAATVVAGVVGRGTVAFDDPVITSNPAFALRDPYVTANATFADLLSHRSGLSTGAGDLLEDMGYDRTYIVTRLNQQPLSAFRATYNYSNFGFTLGALAAADAAHLPWSDLAKQTLFTPIGMTSTSYDHADFAAAANHAALHVPLGGGTWEARYDRTPDAEAPAGGASSSVRDLGQWLRLLLAGGSHDGTPLINTDALTVTQTPHFVNHPPTASDTRAKFYGLGWNVSYDDQGRVSLGHSGAFELGAATAVSLLPGEQLGIVVLTNGAPQGIPEAIAAMFYDVAAHGTPTVDWVGFLATQFKKILAASAPDVDYRVPPPSPIMIPAGRRTGIYDNPYYGPVTVAGPDTALTLTMGPAAAPITVPLTHYNGATWTFQTFGENANGLGGATFTGPTSAGPTTLVLDYYNRTGLGTFTAQ